MAYDNDDLPMTEEKAIKLKAFACIMKMKDAGVPFNKCHLAAAVMVQELRTAYIKLSIEPEEKKQIRISQFDRLERDIKAYLPVPKNLNDEA